MDIVPAGVEAALDPLAHPRRREDDPRYPHPAVVAINRRLPAEVIEDVALPPRVCNVVLPADHVRDPEQVVVHRNREVHQRKDRGVHSRVEGRVHDPHRGVIPHRRVGVGEVRLHPDGHVALIELAVEHLLPEFQVLLHRPLPAGARLPPEFEFPEAFRLADADVGAAEFDELPAPVVVDVQPVALVDDICDPEPQPLDILKHHPVCLRINPSRVGILDTENIPAPIPPHIVIVQDGGPGVPEVQRPARVRCEPHHHTVPGAGQGGQFPRRPLMRLGELVEEFGGYLEKKALSLLLTHRRHLRDHLRRKRTYLPGPAPELRVLAEHRTDDRPALRGVAVLHSVLKSVNEEQVLDIGVHDIRIPD